MKKVAIKSHPRNLRISNVADIITRAHLNEGIDSNLETPKIIDYFEGLPN